MDEYEKKFKEYLVGNNISAKHISFNESCHSVKEAADSVGADEDDFIKSICFVDSNDELVVAIVKGEDRVDGSKVENALGDKVSIAKPKQILKKSGYPCGGVPPFGYKATFLIDSRVMEKDEVYAGGGSSQSLIRISTDLIKKSSNADVVEICD
ncbi:MAG: aminoacyl-tRNA deacylase [Candidatus Woesearchaeota archaeon]